MAQPLDVNNGIAQLIRSAMPDMYQKNAFRILELPVDVGAREIKNRARLIDMAFRQNQELNLNSQSNTSVIDTHSSPVDFDDVYPEGSGKYFALTPSPNHATIQEAVQRIGDPEKRLFDEFFWFWPDIQFGSAKDPALMSLREGKHKEAEETWLEQESLKSDNSVSTHNLAVLYHFKALEFERQNCNRELSEAEIGNIENLWKRTYRRWANLINENGFWDLFTTRIIDINDPRLTAKTAQLFRQSYSAALLSISAQIALQSAETNRKESTSRIAASIRNSGFSKNDIQEGFQLAVEPVHRRIKALCKAAADYSEADPVHADNTCRQLLNSTLPLLNSLDLLLSNGTPRSNVVHDDIAEGAEICLIKFLNKTHNWKIGTELLERITTVAVSESVIKRLKETLDDCRKNSDNNDDFIGEGYFDLPSTILEEMEIAHKHAKAHDFDSAISQLEKLTKTSGFEKKYLQLVNKALAYCLSFRAFDRLNNAMDEWNKFQPSIITKIQNRAKEIDDITWHCAQLETIPQGLRCKCMADGELIYSRYTVFKWTFNDKPVSLIICGDCGDKYREEMNRARSTFKNVVKEAATDFLKAEELDSTNKFIQKQIDRMSKLCTDWEIPFPISSNQRKKTLESKPAQPWESRKAKSSLYLGIVSIFFPIAAFPAIIVGHIALDDIKRSNGAMGGKGRASVGLILGYIRLVILILSLFPIFK